MSGRGSRFSSMSNNYSSVAPPSDINKKQKYSLVEKDEDFQRYELQRKTGRKRVADECDDSYWDHEDDDDAHKAQAEASNNDCDDDEDEEDPLDAFMAGIEKEVKKIDCPKKNIKKDDKKEALANVRLDIEEEDVQESYYKFMEENPRAGLNSFIDDDEEEDGLVEYDKDGNPIINRKKLRYIDPLPPIDHSTIEYSEFNRNFYVEHEEIKALEKEKVNELRKKLEISVMGIDPPKPCISFAHFGFDEDLTKVIIKAGYSQPTPIQCQAIPAALSGRDVLGIAKTGSGKTAAYLWPMLIHIMDQPELKADDGPIGLILAPTRELVQQIHTEARKFAKVYGIRVGCCFGGGSKWEQSKDLQEGCEIVVATPGRMIDMIKCKATNLQRVTILVLDEADRMFDMGFGVQIQSLCDHVRPDRQTLLFSATFKKKVERLARIALNDPVKIVQGELGVANEDVTQKVLVMPAGPCKWEWLNSHLVEFMSAGSVLIFVTKKANAEELANNLKQENVSLVLIHGDMNQIDRNAAISTFKKNETPIMVATDVAARGLDIPHIRTVINYDVARDIDTHTHRIGRTGRAGDKTGVAYTLVTEKDKDFAGHIVRNLEGANQNVPPQLMDLAMQSNWFAKSRYKKGLGKKIDNKPYRARPGLGASKSYASAGKPLSSSSSSSSSYSESVFPSSNSNLSASKNQVDRITAMKSAFKAQFQSNFRPASDSASASTTTAISEKDSKSRKKSRWE